VQGIGRGKGQGLWEKGQNSRIAQVDALLQAKRGDAGHVAVASPNHAPGRKVVPLNGKTDLAIPGEPQLKKAVLQGCDGSIE